MKKISLCVLLSVLVLSVFARLYAEEEPAPNGMGLTVEPGGMLVQYVPLGITYDFTKEVGIPLTIHNRGSVPHTYVLSGHKPSEVGSRKWLGGYLEIPDPGWLWFEQEEVTVEPDSQAKVNLYLKIPDEKKYYNQHWAVSLGITGKPEAGQSVALALYPRIEIETLAKENVSEKPDGVVAVKPSTLVFQDVSLGKKEKINLKIFNGGAEKHTFVLTPMIFPPDSKKRQIFPSPGYIWIPNTEWIKANKKEIKIDSDKAKEVTVEIEVPKEAAYARKNWEAILFIEPEEGEAGFARIQIRTR